MSGRTAPAARHILVPDVLAGEISIAFDNARALTVGFAALDGHGAGTQPSENERRGIDILNRRSAETFIAVALTACASERSRAGCAFYYGIRLVPTPTRDRGSPSPSRHCSGQPIRRSHHLNIVDGLSQIGRRVSDMAWACH
jgi:hypothetical protein